MLKSLNINNNNNISRNNNNISRNNANKNDKPFDFSRCYDNSFQLALIYMHSKFAF
jgi:hypothetical protein